MTIIKLILKCADWVQRSWYVIFVILSDSAAKSQEGGNAKSLGNSEGAVSGSEPEVHVIDDGCTSSSKGICLFCGIIYLLVYSKE